LTEDKVFEQEGPVFASQAHLHGVPSCGQARRMVASTRRYQPTAEPGGWHDHFLGMDRFVMQQDTAISRVLKGSVL
jgi:hypothetical protein